MKTFEKSILRLPLLIFALCLGIHSGSAAPEVNNPSFEMNSATTYPGYTGMFFWSNTAGVGLNPCPYDTNNPSRDLNPFADNGIIPHGTNVVFIQTEPGGGRLWQNIYGFLPGKTFALIYWRNARRYGALPELSVELGGVVIDPPEIVSPVEEVGFHTKPYHLHQSPDFASPILGAGEMAFKIAYYNQDTTVLLDNVSFAEVGSYKILTAKRSTNDITQVTVQFSGPVPVSAQTNASHYEISNGAMVNQASPGLTADTVILLTSPLDYPTNYTLTVSGVLDSAGNAMSSTNRSIAIEIPIPPAPVVMSIGIVGNNIRLQWPSDALGYRVQYSAALGDAASWLDQSGSPSSDGQFYSMSIPKPSSNRFYRLTK